MKIRRIVFLCFVLLPIFAFSQELGTLNVDPLHLQLPATWTFDASKRPIEEHGPDGETLLITIAKKRPDTSGGGGASAEETAQGFAHGVMGELASKGGKTVIRPVSVFPVREGKVAYSAGSERSSMLGGKAYFIQYLLATPDVLLYLTFEGKGNALPAMQRFDAFFETQRWDN